MAHQPTGTMAEVLGPCTGKEVGLLRTYCSVHSMLRGNRCSRLPVRRAAPTLEETGTVRLALGRSQTCERLGDKGGVRMSPF